MYTLLSNIISRLIRRETPVVEKSKIKPPVLNPPLPGTVSLPGLCRAGSEESDISDGPITPEFGFDNGVHIHEDNTHNPYGTMYRPQSRDTITPKERKRRLPLIIVTTVDTDEDISGCGTEQSLNNLQNDLDLLELLWQRSVSTIWDDEEDIGDRTFCSFDDSFDSIDAFMGNHPRSRVLDRIDEEEEEEEESMYSETSWASSTFPYGVMEDINAILAECQLTEEEIWGDWSRWIPNWCKTCKSLAKMSKN